MESYVQGKERVRMTLGFPLAHEQNYPYTHTLSPFATLSPCPFPSLGCPLPPSRQPMAPKSPRNCKEKEGKREEKWKN